MPKPRRGLKPNKSSEFSEDFLPSGLVGRTVVAVRPMTRKEVEQEGWVYKVERAPTVLVLDDNTVLIPARSKRDGKSAPAFLIGNTPGNRPFTLLTELTSETAPKKKSRPRRRASRVEQLVHA